MKLTVKDSKGKDQGELEVKFPMVEGGKGTQAVHDTVVAYQAAQRMGTASTKTMGEVAGSGRKALVARAPDLSLRLCGAAAEWSSGPSRGISAKKSHAKQNSFRCARRSP